LNTQQRLDVLLVHMTHAPKLALISRFRLLVQDLLALVC
jgi:hypothetical protein